MAQVRELVVMATILNTKVGWVSVLFQRRCCLAKGWAEHHKDVVSNQDKTAFGWYVLAAVCFVLAKDAYPADL